MKMVIFARQSDFGYFSTGDEDDAVVLDPYRPDDDVSAVVEDVAYACNQERAIDCLFLCAHGNAGVMWLANGIGKHRAALYFPKLKGMFIPGGRGIELHGCATASSTNIGGYPWSSGQGTADTKGAGYDFLHALARAAGTKVTGSVDTVAGPSAAYKFTRRTMTVYPSGSAYFSNYGETALW